LIGRGICARCIEREVFGPELFEHLCASLRDFRGSDGLTSAQREICRDTSSPLLVEASDAPFTTSGLTYAGQTARTSVTSRVAECCDAGVPESGCGRGPNLLKNAGFELPVVPPGDQYASLTFLRVLARRERRTA
jgi:hypothetical protein